MTEVAASVGVESKIGQKSEPPEVLMVQPIPKAIRKRDKAHLAFVSAQPCLVCKRSPCDAHHLKFARPRALGRKVSDEFTVPLCREHHQELHRPATKLHGGPIYRSHRSGWQPSFGGNTALRQSRVPRTSIAPPFDRP